MNRLEDLTVFCSVATILFLAMLISRLGPAIAFRAGQRLKPSTHDILTRKSIDLFMARNPGIFDFDGASGGRPYSSWLRDGSIDADGLDETDILDEEAGRYLNHFHEVTPAGRSASASESGGASSSGAQTFIPGKDAIEWVFGDDQANRFRWNEAIHAFRLEGARHDGIYSLGHCLHALQDMASPSHTRGDAFGLMDPFDAYGHTRTSVDLPAGAMPPFSQGDPATHFKSLAAVSGASFYSPNTTRRWGSWGYGYPNPGRIEVREVNGKKYRVVVSRGLAGAGSGGGAGSGAGSGGSDFVLATVSLFAKYGTSTSPSNPDTPYVLSSPALSDYHSSLAPEAARYGAALIEDFFRWATVVLKPISTSEVTENSITLRWERNIDPHFLSYAITRSTDGINFTRRETIAENTVIEWIDKLLSPRTKYYYRMEVRFRNDNAVARSNIVEATTGTAGDMVPPATGVFSVVDRDILELQFSESVREESAENTYNYEIDGPLAAGVFTGGNVDMIRISGDSLAIGRGVRPDSVTLRQDGRTVEIAIDRLQEGGSYTLAVRNVVDLSGNMMETATLPFTGKVPPGIQSAKAIAGTAIQIIFDEPVTTVSAETASNYDLFPMLNVYSADLMTGAVEVRLTADQQLLGERYTLTVRGVKDFQGNDISRRNTAKFTGSGK